MDEDRCSRGQVLAPTSGRPRASSSRACRRCRGSRCPASTSAARGCCTREAAPRRRSGRPRAGCSRTSSRRGAAEEAAVDERVDRDDLTAAAPARRTPARPSTCPGGCRSRAGGARSTGRVRCRTATRLLLREPSRDGRRHVPDSLEVEGGAIAHVQFLDAGRPGWPRVPTQNIGCASFGRIDMGGTAVTDGAATTVRVRPWRRPPWVTRANVLVYALRHPAQPAPAARADHVRHQARHAAQPGGPAGSERRPVERRLGSRRPAEPGVGLSVPDGTGVPCR